MEIAAELMHALHEKDKSTWEQAAEKFWKCRMHKMQKKMKHAAKKFAKRAIYYLACPEMDAQRKKVATRCMSKAIQRFTHMRMKSLREERKEGPHGMPPMPPFGMMPPPFGMPGMFPPPPPPCGPCGPHGRKRGPGCIMKHMMMTECSKFVLAFKHENCEFVKTCLPIVKAVVDEALGKCKCCPDEMKEKIAGKVVAKIYRYLGPEVTKEQCVDFTKKYLGTVTPCPKACVKRCRAGIKMAMRLNGVKDKCVLHVGCRWGAIMCCKANGHQGCSKDVCAEFAAKWAKERTQDVVAAIEAIREIKKGCKECQCGGKFEYMTIARKMVLSYLKLNCAEGKFNKEEFGKFVHARLENCKKFEERYGKCTECGKGCCEAGVCKKA